MLWRVTIPYQEPTYSVRQGAQKTYDAFYVIEASSREAAIASALGRFEGLATESGVRWIREVLADRISATPAGTR
tara:strand:+ start:138 stop:362 length:225 start_codon:yes stop_codon:yes gene_type:complete